MEENERDETAEADKDIGSLDDQVPSEGESPDLVDSDDEEDVPDCPNEILSAKQRRRREARLRKEEEEQARVAALHARERARDDEAEAAGSLTVGASAGGYRSIDAVGKKDRRSDSRKPVGATKVAGRRLRLARGITVDSGAADNVMPRRMLRGRNKIRPSPASRAGVHYVVANDGRIPNEGEADFQFQTQDGKPLSWLFQIAEVNKTLAAVSALVDAGHRVVFDRDDDTKLDTSFITNKETGTSIKMRRERNVWVIDAYVDEDAADTDSLFSRQE